AGTGVQWATIGTLAVIWAAAPVAAGLLGYALTRALDVVPAIRVQSQVTGAVLAGVTAGDSPAGSGGNTIPVPASRGAPVRPGLTGSEYSGGMPATRRRRCRTRSPRASLTGRCEPSSGPSPATWPMPWHGGW
ncbi:MAG: hypothetical protein LBI49_09755, partial [Nocardiopsaceae bacterium]|nr:hypothetical protein [Nocardiopsaceae bacterium]